MTHPANAVVAGDALELALSGVTGMPIDVVGGRARQLITWLRRGGHDARALDTSSTARTQSRGDDRVSSGIVVTTDWTREADPIKLFRSLKRQLTPDGRLVVIAPNLTYIGVRLSPSQRRDPLAAAASLYRCRRRRPVEPGRFRRRGRSAPGRSCRDLAAAADLPTRGSLGRPGG